LDKIIGISTLYKEQVVGQVAILSLQAPKLGSDSGGSGFSNDANSDSSGISHVVFDLIPNFICQNNGLIIG